jgi:hypothetical protein
MHSRKVKFLEIPAADIDPKYGGENYSQETKNPSYSEGFSICGAEPNYYLSSF